MKLVLFVVFNLQIAVQCIFGQVIIARNTQVTPRCGSQIISIEVNFDPTHLPDGKFTDWIVVGISGRPECRLRGNGETKYIIEIAVFNDPCLTQIPAQNVFQNRIRFGKNPIIILEEDLSVTVKCVYGLPTVETMALPVINSNFNIDNFGVSKVEEDQPELNKLGNSPNWGAPKTSLSVDETSRGLKNGDSDKSDTNNIHSQNVDSDDANSLTSTVSGHQLNHNHVEAENFFSESQHTEGSAAMKPTNFSNHLKSDVKNFELISSGNKKNAFSFLYILMMICVAGAILVFVICTILFFKQKQASSHRRLLIEKASDMQLRVSSDNVRPSLYSGEKIEHPITLQPALQLDSSHDETDLRKIDSSRRSHENLNPKEIFIGLVSHSSNSKNKTSTSRKTVKTGRKTAEPKSSNLPLKSNLEEFVSKTYALGEYNSASLSVYGYGSEDCNEKNVEVDYESENSKEEVGSKKIHPFKFEDAAVSSFCSITEIVHAAETASVCPGLRKNENTTELQDILRNCVSSIRGFGYKKLTEQEIIRWKALIQQDAKLCHQLMTSKSSVEIENIFENEEYKNMFSSSKWHEIASCVHRALTHVLDRANSQSELQLFVGNVQTDW